MSGPAKCSDEDAAAVSMTPPPLTDTSTIQNPGLVDECWRPPEECVESFVFEGVTYSGCATIGLKEGLVKFPWCSHHASHTGYWSYCMPNCGVATTSPEGHIAPPPGQIDCWVPNPLCVDTFQFKNVTYKGCTTVENGNKGWCSKQPVFKWMAWSECEWDCTYGLGVTTPDATTTSEENTTIVAFTISTSAGPLNTNVSNVSSNDSGEVRT